MNLAAKVLPKLPMSHRKRQITTIFLQNKKLPIYASLPSRLLKAMIFLTSYLLSLITASIRLLPAPIFSATIKNCWRAHANFCRLVNA